MNWFYLSLKYFTQEQQQYLISVITSIKAGFTACESEEQNQIIYLFSKLPSFDEDEMDLVYDYVLRRLIGQKFVCLYEVNKGENFNVEIVKDVSSDWSNTILVVRNDETNELLSNNFTEATNDPVQYILVQNFPYEYAKLYKLRITLEEANEQNVSDGNAISVVGYVYVMSSKTIDE